MMPRSNAPAAATTRPPLRSRLAATLSITLLATATTATAAQTEPIPPATEPLPEQDPATGETAPDPADRTPTPAATANENDGQPDPWDGGGEKATDSPAVGHLFGDFDKAADFSDAIEKAVQAKADPQLVFEAKIRYFLYEDFDEASVRKLLREFDERLAGFDPKRSRLFDSANSLAATREVALAIIALREKEGERLKRHAIEAIWLDQTTAEIVASLIRSYHQYVGDK